VAFSDESLPERIRRRSDKLSPSQKKIARFCVTEPHKAGTLTALRIAEELLVSESTVVRFAVRMGYLGFPDMQAAIRHASERQDVRSSDGNSDKERETFDESLEHDLQLLRETISAIDEKRLERAVAELDRAQTLHVVGFRTAFSLSYLAEYHIRQVRGQVRLVGGVGGTYQDDMAQIGEEDALLAFTFPVYDDRTIEVIEATTALGASCVVVTDSALAPLPLGENVYMIIARHEGLSFFNSNVAAVAIINAIVMRMVHISTEREPKFARDLNEKFQRERARRA
jgi:DNA-binding MurR/RpiR family transcriptional regulator